MQTKTVISSTSGRRQAPTEKPQELSAGHRIRLRPTRFGITFFFILTAMLLGALNSNNNLGFLLTFLLGSMAAVSVFHTRRNLAGIRLAHMRARPVFAGEAAHFEISLRKPGRAARAVDVLFSGQAPVTLDRVDDSPSAVTIGLPAGQRGLLTPGPLGILSCYPFGLFQARAALPHSAGCIVYPRPIDGSLQTIPDEPVTGAGAGRAGPGVEDFAGLKAYQPGDNLGHISWKAYSRGQGLLVKQFSGESGRLLTVDWQALDEPNLERKLSRLCGMVLHAHQTGLPFGLRLPGAELTPARGERHLQACLSQLALFGLPGGMTGPRTQEPRKTETSVTGRGPGIGKGA